MQACKYDEHNKNSANLIMHSQLVILCDNNNRNICSDLDAIKETKELPSNVSLHVIAKYRRYINSKTLLKKQNN